MSSTKIWVPCRCQCWARSEFLASYSRRRRERKLAPDKLPPTSLKERMNTCLSRYSRGIGSFGSLENTLIDRDTVFWYVPESCHSSFLNLAGSYSHANELHRACVSPLQTHIWSQQWLVSVRFRLDPWTSGLLTTACSVSPPLPHPSVFQEPDHSAPCHAIFSHQPCC